MTWITCPRCGYVDTVSSINVVFKPEPNEDGSLVVEDIWHGATRWKCPKCCEKCPVIFDCHTSPETCKVYNE